MKTGTHSRVVRLLISALGLLNSACTETTSQASAAQDPCDSPDAPVACCFLHAPAPLTSVLAMGSANEPGAPLIISGTLLRADGKTPYAGVLLYAYQTDHTGHYTKTGGETGVQKWHGHLHGWAKSDGKGHYEIRSVRPAPYPGGTAPAHIHAAIQEPNLPPYYISDFVFADDSLVTPAYLASRSEPGGTGVVALRRAAGTWVGERNIVLKK